MYTEKWHHSVTDTHLLVRIFYTYPIFVVFFKGVTSGYTASHAQSQKYEKSKNKIVFKNNFLYLINLRVLTI